MDRETVAALNAGTRATRDLVEAFTIDFAMLLRAAAPAIANSAGDRLAGAGGASHTARMRLAGELLRDSLDDTTLRELAAHPSDTVRGWVCFAVGEHNARSLDERLRWLRPLADDAHFGVREWAWLGVRNAIVAEPNTAIEQLIPWTGEASENLRRFASEATRPRGVWSAHIPVLKAEPERARPLLDPLRADPSRYVQNSVANWLNDASKTAPDWVHAVCTAWTRGDPEPATVFICTRALRSIKKL